METEGKSGCWSARQLNTMSTMDSELIGFKIEKLFNMTTQMGQHMLTGIMVLSSQYQMKNRILSVKWNQDCLDQDKPKKFKEKQLASK